MSFCSGLCALKSTSHSLTTLQITTVLSPSCRLEMIGDIDLSSLRCNTYLRQVELAGSLHACCCFVKSSGESALNQKFKTWNTHNGVCCEWLWPTFVPGTRPAGSVDASWLTFGSFLRCSCKAFSEPISSQELLETLETFWHILKQFILFVASRFRHFPLAVQLWLPRHLIQELAEQLDHEGDSCWLPIFEAAVPPSDTQLPRFLVSACFES